MVTLFQDYSNTGAARLPSRPPADYPNDRFGIGCILARTIAMATDQRRDHAGVVRLLGLRMRSPTTPTAGCRLAREAATRLTAEQPERQPLPDKSGKSGGRAPSDGVAPFMTGANRDVLPAHRLWEGT